MLFLVHQEEIGGDGHGEAGAFDDHEANYPPPRQAAMAERVRGQLGKVAGEARLEAHEITGSGSGCGDFGQNQAIKAIVAGTAPNGTAHGLKIDDTNMTVTAIVETNGQMLGIPLGSRTSGSAAMTLVNNNSRSSTRRPWTTPSLSPASHKGVRPSTIGIWAKL